MQSTDRSTMAFRKFGTPQQSRLCRVHRLLSLSQMTIQLRSFVLRGHARQKAKPG